MGAFPPFGEAADASSPGIRRAAGRRYHPVGSFMQRCFAEDWYRPPPMATLIDGTEISARVRARVTEEAAEFVAEIGHTPGLVTILVGEDPASQVYVRSKGERTREVGMASCHEQLPATASQDEVMSTVARWNADERVDGILVQLPL